MKNVTAKIISLVACLAIAFAASATSPEGAPAYKGEKMLGLQVGYISYNQSATAGVIFSYRFSRNFRLSPGVTYAFRRHDSDALMLNINAHFPIPLTERFEVFPLAGLNFSNWTFHNSATNDAASRTLHAGVNVGAGVMGAPTERLRLGVVGEYTFIERFHGAAVRAVIAYRF